MFVENYLSKTDASSKEKKKTAFSFFKKKKNTEPKKEREVPFPDKPKKPKKNRSTSFYIAVFFITGVAVIGGLKGFKQYKAESAKEMTSEDKAEFEQKIKESIKTPAKPISQIHAKPIKTEKVQESKQKEHKRELSGYLLSQDATILFEDDGVKLVLSGATFTLNEKIYKDYYISDIRISKQSTSIDDAVILFTISKDSERIREIRIKLSDSYRLYYYYESVEIEPVSNPSLKTEMIFSGSEIKPNFEFTSFEDKDNAVFNFKVFGKELSKEVSLDELL